MAVARVLGISSSNPQGCRFEEIATERLVGVVDEPVEAFGGVGGDREEPDVVDDEVARRTRMMVLDTVSSTRCLRSRTPRS